MTLTDAWRIFQEAMPALGLLCGLVVLLLGTRFVRHHRCDEHRKSIQGGLEETDSRRRKLEKAIHGLPTAGDLGAMKESVSRLTTQVSVLQESLNGQKALFTRLEGQVDRIDNFLKRMPN